MSFWRLKKLQNRREALLKPGSCSGPEKSSKIRGKRGKNHLSLCLFGLVRGAFASEDTHFCTVSPLSGRPGPCLTPSFSLFRLSLTIRPGAFSHRQCVRKGGKNWTGWCVWVYVEREKRGRWWEKRAWESVAAPRTDGGRGRGGVERVCWVQRRRPSFPILEYIESEEKLRDLRIKNDRRRRNLKVFALIVVVFGLILRMAPVVFDLDFQNKNNTGGDRKYF